MIDTPPTGAKRPLRFGVVAPVGADVPAWRDRVRRIADNGYSTLLMPDVPEWQPAPAPALAVAATVADLRVGTWVYAAPVRPAWSTAWEAHSLSVLTDGRFEMGIGTGRPGIEDQLQELGLPVVPPSGRLAEVRKSVAALRQLDGPDRHTPVAMAVRGPKAQALAAEVADTVTFVTMPGETGAETAQRVKDFRASRVTRDLELALHVSVVGDGGVPEAGRQIRDTGDVLTSRAGRLAARSATSASLGAELAKEAAVVGADIFLDESAVIVAGENVDQVPDDSSPVWRQYARGRLRKFADEVPSIQVWHAT